MRDWDDSTKVKVGRRAAAVLAGTEALYILLLLLGLAQSTDADTGDSLAPVAAALSIVIIPIVIAFGATARMLWRGRIWPTVTGRSGAVRNFTAVGLVTLINGALAAQALVGVMTIHLETSRAIAGFVGLIVAAACVLLIRQSLHERYPAASL